MIVNYVIQVTYPPNVTEEDVQEHLGELIDTMSRYGLGVDGWTEGGDEEGDEE